MTKPMPVLTLQQLRVVLQLAEGRDYKQIAFALHITPRTVRLHVCRIAKRIGGGGSPKYLVLLNADRLICAQPIDSVSQARAA